MTKRNFTEEELNEFFVFFPETEEYIHGSKDGDDFYKWKKGIDGAEIFSEKDLEDMFILPENEELKNRVVIISVKNAIDAEQEKIENFEVNE